MRRWVAVGLGGITALGMHALFEALTTSTGSLESLLVRYGVLFAALVLGGYVAGHLASHFQVFHGALAAVVYIFVTVTINALREAPVARQLGMGALAPIDFVELAITDVIAMVGASCGGWLASRL